MKQHKNDRMLPIHYSDLSNCTKREIPIPDMKAGQCDQIQLKNNLKSIFGRFNKRIHDTLYFVKIFTVNGKLKGWTVCAPIIKCIYKIDYKFEYMFEGKLIIKDYNIMNLSLMEVEYE
jgi:hypothetical protein